jgi:hypothetical protein
MSKYVFIVMSNPTAGNESEYNEWYDKVHLPDVLNVPGFVAAQRFRLGDTQFGDGNRPHRYLALYEVETDDMAATLKELTARIGSEDMVMSDSIDMANLGTFIYGTIGEKMMAKDVRRPARGSAAAR